MTSAILEIDFANEQDQEQFRCASDASQEEKSNTPPRSKIAPPPPRDSDKHSVSSQKRAGGLADTCRTIYDDIRRSLKRVPSAGKEDKSKRGPSSFAKTLADMSDFIDEPEHTETPAAVQANVVTIKSGTKVTRQPLKGVPTPTPPVALRKPVMDSDGESSSGDLVDLIRPPPLKSRTGSTSSVPTELPFKRRAGSSQEMDKGSIRMLATSKKASSLKGINPPAMPPPAREDEEFEIRPPTLSDDPLDAHHSPPFDESVVKPSEADISAIPPPASHDDGMSQASENRGHRREEEDSAANTTPARSNKWLASRLDDTLYGKVAAMRWSCAQVGEFLEACGLSMYARNFAENGVDGPCLMDLSHDQIKRGLHITEKMHLLSLEMGVDYIRQRKIRTVKDWDWSCARTSEWLEAKGLGCLVAKFKAEAVHGGVLFSLNEDQFVSELEVNKGSVLHLMSLLACIERAKEVGPLRAGEDVPDWPPSKVKAWLESLSLGHLVPIFRQYAVNGALLLYLDARTMVEEMHLTEIQSIVLERAIQKLRRRQTKRQSFWGTTWRKISGLFKSPRKGARMNENVTPVKAARKPSASSAARSTAVEFGQGTFASLTATYSKYGGAKNRKTYKALKNEPASFRRPVPTAAANPQPSSPMPSRPPRPTAQQQPQAPPTSALKSASNKASSKGLAVRQATVKYGSRAKDASEQESTNTMSIL